MRRDPLVVHVERRADVSCPLARNVTDLVVRERRVEEREAVARLRCFRDIRTRIHLAVDKRHLRLATRRFSRAAP
jgi:hypothetical protein